MSDLVLIGDDGSIPVDWETVRETIVKELDDIDGPSEITTAPNPGLTVNGIGAIGLPLVDRDAEDIISKCRQSPFGKGGETVVDTDVRNCFELDPSQFTLRNPAWNACVAALVDIVYKELALTCGREHVVPELYKLLLYEEGAFFRSHQDSEKTPGMFGTLVVSLPSEHKGGTVLLKHQKDQYHFDSSNTSAFGTAFAAWYSDVFHEVEKVTSGHRLVLTYNLVQKGTSILQKAPDGDGTKRLATALEVYNKGLEYDYADWPNFVCYGLEHTYSQNGLSLSALKGRDLALVDTLRSICDKNGYDLYLALKEKCIDKDDDYGSEEFDRTEEFKYVHDLGGRPQAMKPTYDKINLLEDGNATDDEDADESEHEGWTGNEGAPAHYWYRSTMVVMVPPSRKIDFCLDTEDGSFKGPLGLVQKYRSCRPNGGSYEAQHLTRLCSRLVSKCRQSDAPLGKQAFGMGFYDEQKLKDERRCMEQVAALTLEMGWFDVHTTIPAYLRRTEPALEALGTYMTKCKDYLPAMRLLQDTIREAPGIKAQVQALKGVQRGIPAGFPNDILLEALHASGGELLMSTLDTTPALRKDAAESLATTVVDFGEHVQEAVITLLKKCKSPTVARFVICLARMASDDHPVARIFMLEQMIGYLWSSSFTFEGPEFRETIQLSYGGTRQGDPDFIVKEELQQLLILTEQHGPKAMSVFDAMDAFSTASPGASSAYAQHQLFLFVSSVIKRELELLFPYNTRTPNDKVVTFIKVGLTAVITCHIGPEPQGPTNFALPRARSCNCRDCHQVNDFLASQQRVLKIPIAKKGRAHLHSYFTNKGNGWYDVTTIDRGSPHIWQITKAHDKQYKTAHLAWESRVKWLSSELRKLAMAGDSLLNEEILGSEVYSGVMNCTVEGLKGTEAGKALAESSGNVRKRKADDGTVGGGKKARGENLPGGVEVIDLT